MGVPFVALYNTQRPHSNLDGLSCRRQPPGLDARATANRSGHVVVTLLVKPDGTVERIELVSATPPQMYDQDMQKNVREGELSIQPRGALNAPDRKTDSGYCPRMTASAAQAVERSRTARSTPVIANTHQIAADFAQIGVLIFHAPGRRIRPRVIDLGQSPFSRAAIMSCMISQPLGS